MLATPPRNGRTPASRKDFEATPAVHSATLTTEGITVSEPLALPAPKPPTAAFIAVWVAIAVGVRLALSAISYGTDDATIWGRFAEFISQRSLTELYRIDPYFNHPPLPALYAGWIWEICGRLGVSFGSGFRLLPILTDALLVAVLARTTGLRWIAAAFALDPISILESAFHTNTDSVYACLLCVGVILLARGKSTTAGMCLGMALNVKLLPLVVILPLLFSLPLKVTKRVILGMLPWGLPFLVAFVRAPQPFLDHVFGYTGLFNHWGLGELTLVIRWLAGWTFDVRPLAGPASKLLLAASIGLGLLWRRKVAEKPEAVLELAATAAAMFSALTVSYATQYTVLLLPLLYLVSPRFGLTWSLTCGVFIATNYGVNSNWTIPLAAEDTGYIHRPAARLAAVAPWAVSMAYLIYAMTNRSKKKEPRAPDHT